MVLAYHGIDKSEKELADSVGVTKELGTDDVALKRVLESFGLKATIQYDSNFTDIQNWLAKDVLVIVDWFTRGRSDYTDADVPDGHYSIVVGLDEDYIYLQDPEIGGLRKLKRDDFMKVWFDFRGEKITSWDDMIVRQSIAVTR